MGGIATVASEAVGRLFDDGIPCAFGVLAAVSPPPREHLAALLARYPVVVCVEAHRASGGLGSIVCEINGEHGLGCRVVRAGIDGMPAGITGSQAYLEARAGLSREALVARVREALEAGAPLRRRGERA
jgi:transketolase